MSSRAISVFGIVVTVFALFFFSGNVNADECEIRNYGFVQGSIYQDEGVPLFINEGGTGSIASIKVETNNSQDCDGKKVYLTVFSLKKTQNNKYVPLENIKNVEYLLPASDGLNTSIQDYGINITYYANEEKCEDYGPEVLKNLVDKNPNVSIEDFKSLLQSDSTVDLYKYLNGEITLNELNKIAMGFGTTDRKTYEKYRIASKKLLYQVAQKIDSPIQLTECAYLPRVTFDVVDLDSNETSDGKPFNIQNKDDRNKVLLYMCGDKNYSAVAIKDDVKCNNNPWEKRSAQTATSSGYDPNDPCLDSNKLPIPGCYELLAPIPGFGETIDFDGDPNDPNSEPFALEKLFKALIDISIGAISVLAVLAVMYYGFKFMQSRSTGNIPDLMKYKSRALSVLYGIGVILGSYIILNTINPELLILFPDIEKVTFGNELGDGFQTTTGDSGISGIQKSEKCPEGVVPINHAFGKTYVCKTKEEIITKLFKDAQSNGIPLGGGGHRTTEQQIALRKKHCNGDISNHSAKCVPPTAVPGTSRHESGYAIDFNCNKNGILSENKKCFNWLVENAKKYGLKNYKPEPWHWSFDGK